MDRILNRELGINWRTEGLGFVEIEDEVELTVSAAGQVPLFYNSRATTLEREP
jgi:hypothetical protein